MKKIGNKEKTRDFWKKEKEGAKGRQANYLIKLLDNLFFKHRQVECEIKLECINLIL